MKSLSPGLAAGYGGGGGIAGGIGVGTGTGQGTWERDSSRAVRGDNALPVIWAPRQISFPPCDMKDGQALCLLLRKRNLPPENKTFCVQMQPSAGLFLYRKL